ncbi:hypothetical protein HTG_14930 [Natrinema mahii]|nr:hypothetical protein HTG_14930 [Natrinema mahii]
MRIDRAELRKGLAETRTFLLAHHLPAEFDRCYAVTVFGRRLHLCARCLGVYPGIAAGLLASFVWNGAGLLAVAVLPAPALFDWTVTTFSARRGSNPVRTVTGFLLGCGYGLGLALLAGGSSVQVLGIGALYATISGCLLYYSW